jgi:FAD synthase
MVLQRAEFYPYAEPTDEQLKEIIDSQQYQSISELISQMETASQTAQ